MIDFPRLWTVFWPILLTFIGGRLVLQTDLIMVSRLGQSATAAFGIPLRIMLLDTILAFALAPVVAVLVAERREPGERAWVVRQALSLAAVLGVALVGAGLLVYPYAVRLVTADEEVVRLAQGAVFWLTLAIPLRLVDFVGGMSLHGLGRGRRVIPVKLAEIGINAALNWLLVYKLEFGFPGCYLGTLIASAVSVCWVLSILRSEIGPGPMLAVPDAAWARSTMSKAAVEFGRLVSEKTVAFLTLWIFASGQGGVARLSAFSVAMEFQMLIFMPMIALMRATAISLSAEGAKTDLGGLYRSIRGVAVPGAAACAAVGALIGVFGGRIGWHLYRLDPAAMDWWIPMTAAFAVWLPMRFLDALQRGAWQSKKLFKEITVRETAVGWIFLLPCLFVAVRAQSPWLAWGTLLAGESLVALLLLVAARPGLRAVAAAALLLAGAAAVHGPSRSLV